MQSTQIVPYCTPWPPAHPKQQRNGPKGDCIPGTWQGPHCGETDGERSRGHSHATIRLALTAFPYVTVTAWSRRVLKPVATFSLKRSSEVNSFCVSWEYGASWAEAVSGPLTSMGWVGVALSSKRVSAIAQYMA